MTLESKLNVKTKRTCPSFHCFASSGSCPSSIAGSPDCQKRCQMDSALNRGERIIYFFIDGERGGVYSVKRDLTLAGWLKLDLPYRQKVQL